MKSFLLLLALGLATSDKLDRTYLPPPGSNQAGGSPGAIQIPFEYPKETYQTINRPSVNSVTPDDPSFYLADNEFSQNNQGNAGPVNEAYGSINDLPINYSKQLLNLPTTTTSYAFTQTTTFPPNEGFETTVSPFVALENGSILNQGQNLYSRNPALQSFQNGQVIGQNPTLQSFQNGQVIGQNPALQPHQVPQLTQNNGQTEFSQQQPTAYQNQPHYENQYEVQQPNQQEPIFGSQIQSGQNQYYEYPRDQQLPENYNIQNTNASSLISQSGSQSVQNNYNDGLQPNSDSQLYQNQENQKINDLIQFSSPQSNLNQNSESTSISTSDPYFSQPDYSSSTSSSFSTIPYDDLTTSTPELVYNENQSPVKSIKRPERPRAELDRNAEILSYENIITPEGYAFSYDTSNGIHADESASTTNGVKAQGSYSYTGDDGKEYSVIYTADENGFQPRGDHLPTPPPIPEAIKRVIEQAARNREAGIIDDGSYDESKYGYKNYETGSKKRPQESLTTTANTGNLDNILESSQFPSSQDSEVAHDNNKIGINRPNDVSGVSPTDLKQYNAGREDYRTQKENHDVHQSSKPEYANKPVSGFNENTVNQPNITKVSQKIAPNQNQDYPINKSNRLHGPFPKAAEKTDFGLATNKPQERNNQGNSKPVSVLQNDKSNTKVSEGVNNDKSQYKRPDTSFSSNVLSQPQLTRNQVQKLYEENNNRFIAATPSSTPKDYLSFKNQQHSNQKLNQPSSKAAYQSIKNNQQLFTPSGIVQKPNYDPFVNSKDNVNQLIVYPNQEKQQFEQNSNSFVNNNRFQRPNLSTISPNSQNAPESAGNTRNKSSKDISTNVNREYKPKITAFDEIGNRNNEFKSSEGYQYIPPQSKFFQEKYQSFPSQVPSFSATKDNKRPQESTSSFYDRNTAFGTPSNSNKNVAKYVDNNLKPFIAQKPGQNENSFDDKDYEYLEEDDQGKERNGLTKSTTTTIKPQYTTSQPRLPTKISQNFNNQLPGTGPGTPGIFGQSKTNANYVPSTTSFPSRFRATEPGSKEILSQYSSTTPKPTLGSITSTSPVYPSALPPRNNLRKSQNRVPSSTYRPQYDTDVIPQFGMKILAIQKNQGNNLERFKDNGIPNSNQNLESQNVADVKNTQLFDTTRPLNPISSTNRGPFGSDRQPQENVQIFSDDGTSQVIGEDFSGPKQPQRFDPKTGYHY